MATYKRQEYLDALKTLVGDKNDDDTLAMIKNFTETFDSMSKPEKDGEDWKTKYDELKKESDTKYNELDTTWRNKYRDTFFSGTNDKDFENAKEMQELQNEEDSGQGITIDDLFADK